VSTQAERDRERDEAFERVFSYLSNPHPTEQIVLPDVTLADGTVIAGKTITVPVKPDFV
jgi:hypothetical protein